VRRPLLGVGRRLPGHPDEFTGSGPASSRMR
jgi:hypothetical protein